MARVWFVPASYVLRPTVSKRSESAFAKRGANIGAGECKGETEWRERTKVMVY